MMIQYNLADPMHWLMDLVAATSLSDVQQKQLLNAYLQSSRGYHGLFHIAFMWYCHNELSYLTHHIKGDVRRTMHTRIADATACHDIIHNVHSTTNEVDSANWWTVAAASNLRDKTVQQYDHIMNTEVKWTSLMIQATADHMANRPLITDDDYLLQWFLGLDLLSLAIPADAFDRNAWLIRAEYSHLSDDKWHEGRKGFLAKLDKAPAIFRYPEFHQRFEDQARANIKRALAA